MHTRWQPYICLRGSSGLFSSQLPFPFLHPPLTFRTCQEATTQSLDVPPCRLSFELPNGVGTNNRYGVSLEPERNLDRVNNNDLQRTVYCERSISWLLRC